MMRFVALVLCSLTILVITYYTVTLNLRRQLPWSARILREHYWADGFLPDFDYELEAQMTKNEFINYIDRIGLTNHRVVKEDQKKGVSDLEYRLDEPGSFLHVEFRNGTIHVSAGQY